MSFRDTASFGKRQEYRVIAELLARGFDVYMTLVDDQGIDCIIRLNESTYIDIQTKARSKKAATQYKFPNLPVIPRRNYFYIFYFEARNEYWVVPTLDLADMCYNYKGKYDFSVPTKDNVIRERGLNRYINDAGFDLLDKYHN